MPSEKRPGPDGPRSKGVSIDGQPDALLADELAALGEQLSDDAARLAAAYPPAAADELLGRAFWSEDPLPASRGRRPALRRAGIAAAAGLAAVALTLGLTLREPPQRGAGPAAPPASVAAGSAASGPVEAAPAVVAPAVVTAGLFEDLSGPEQEALLDLMEQHDGLALESLSI